MKKVLVFGTFDGLHSGHLDLFRQARNYGDYLMAVIARDKTVKKIKNHFPSKKETKRLKDVQKCRLINEARLGYEDNPYRVIKEINPDVICLGYDQKAFTESLPRKLKKMGLKTKLNRMKSYKPKEYHSFIINVRHKIYSPKF